MTGPSYKLYLKQEIHNVHGEWTYRKWEKKGKAANTQYSLSV